MTASQREALECPLWVISRHCGGERWRPLCANSGHPRLASVGQLKVRQLKRLFVHRFRKAMTVWLARAVFRQSVSSLIPTLPELACLDVGTAPLMADRRFPPPWTLKRFASHTEADAAHSRPTLNV
jgi:hypothetical protein